MEVMVCMRVCTTHQYYVLLSVLIIHLLQIAVCHCPALLKSLYCYNLLILPPCKSNSSCFGVRVGGGPVSLGAEMMK